MPNLHTAANRHATRTDRHTTRRDLQHLCQRYQELTAMSDDLLFDDLGLVPKKTKPQETGLLDFPATYDTTPAQVTQPTGPILEEKK